MRYQRFFPFLALLLLCTPLAAEEFELTFASATMSPTSFSGSTSLQEGQSGWTNSDKLLTDHATTLQVYFVNFSSGGSMLVSLDRAAEGEGKPDTLYLDLNGNKAIDSEERFPLTPPANDEPIFDPYTMLNAKKVPMGDGEASNRHVNIHCLMMENQDEGASNHLFGISAWGCYQGKVTLNDVTYKVTLEDRNANGSYSDYEVEGEWNADYLAILPEGNDSEKNQSFVLQNLPLRKKMLIDGNAYTVQVKNNGMKLSLDPIEVQFGKVAATDEHLTVTLSHADWGTQHVSPGQKASLPAGTWKVTTYQRMKQQPMSYCMYRAPSNLQVEVKPDEAAVLDLETDLKASVSAKKRGGILNLSLSMATESGASFGGFYKQDETVRGIPFKITNGAGETIKEDHFKFG